MSLIKKSTFEESLDVIISTIIIPAMRVYIKEQTALGKPIIIAELFSPAQRLSDTIQSAFANINGEEPVLPIKNEKSRL